MSEGRPLTGRKVLLIILAFFGVIITVNLVLAFNAIRTFPGLEEPAKLEATVGRATERRSDVTPAFGYSDGAFRAPLDLAPGIWEVRLKAYSDDGTLFRQTRELFVKE